MLSFQPTESERLATLYAYNILDTPPEEAFDRVTRLAAALSGVPVALVSLVDEHRQWFKSAFGLDARESPRANSFCSYAISTESGLIVEDASADPRFANNPGVVGPPHIRFYAGIPLTVRSGHRIGTLCLLDHRPRRLPPQIRALLDDLAAMVVDALELRLALRHARAETDEHRQDRELLKSAALVGAVVEDSEDPIFVKDLDGRYLLLNQATADIIGYPRDYILGKTDDQVMAAEVLRPLREVDRLVAITGRATAVEEILPSRDGPRTFHTIKSPLADDDGRIIGVVGIARDITTRKQVEQALIRAKEEADRANRAKSDFLSAMSHELRTPLNAVLGFSQMLEMNAREPLTATQRKCVDHIHRAGQHLLDLINEVLDLAKIEAGRLTLVLEETSLRHALRESVLLVLPMAEPQKIAVTIESEDDADVIVCADGVRLKQILVNLLSNAIKYNRPAGSVTIRCAPGIQGRHRVTVHDTGLGISPAMLDHLFEPFNRLGADISDIQGTGIGLTITRQLALLMGGDIGVSSQVDQGSAFWVELPLADESRIEMPAGDVRH